MIVNHTHRFIFIHVPKAAGTSLTRKLSELTRYCDQEIGGTAHGKMVTAYYQTRYGLTKHARALTVRKIVGDAVWEDYFTMAFVRNPYTRIVSAFEFLKGWKECPARHRDILDRLGSTQSFLESSYWIENEGPDHIFSPQTYWTCDRIEKGRVLLDHVGRTETLEADMQLALKRIGVAVENPMIEKANRSARRHGEIRWTPELVARVQERYAADFKTFGYPSTPPHANLD